jgi:autotransporter-associated beta strand protein
MKNFGDTVGTLSVFDGSVTLGSATLVLSGTLSMSGGSISATTGSLSLGGDITATSSAAGGASITSKIALNATRTITVNSGAKQPELTITGVLSDGAASSGITKAGTGTLNLLGNAGNTFTGTTDVDKGVMQIATGTGNIIPGPLVIGNNVDPANSAILREFNQSSDISPTSTVTINSSGQLDMANEIDTVGKLTGTGNIQMQSSSSLSVNSDNSNSSFIGTISGTGGNFKKNGTGFFILTGNNTYSGKVTVAGGTLLLNGATPNTVIQGSLVIGTGAGAANSCLVQLLLADQIKDTSSVTVMSDGKFDNNTLNEQVGPLIVSGGNVTIGSATLAAGDITMTGGTISATSGALNMQGSITAISSATASAAISANMTLNATRTITVNPGPIQPELIITSVISNGAAVSGLSKAGTGTLNLISTTGNTFTGVGTIDKGIVQMNSAVSRIFQGNVVIGNNVDPANSAILRELNLNDIAFTSQVTINPSGVLDLNTFSDTVGALLGSGSVMVKATLTIGKDNSAQTYSGIISGTGAVVKAGTGTQTFTGNNTYTGATNLQAGMLLVNGSQPGSTVNVSAGATLGGTGTVGAVNVVASNLSPGVNGVGTLSTGNLSLDATSTIALDLVSGASFDSLNVTGTVNLGGCALSLNIDPNFIASAVPIVLINNDAADAITGTFKNFTEGQTVPTANLNSIFSYVGGTGNDVSLVALNVPPMLTSSIVATPSPAAAGQTITFSAPATDANNDTLTFAWNFGDGMNASGASVTHSYPLAGTYAVSVMVSDGFGGSVNGSIMLVVNPPLVGSGTDTDGDGFSDAFEAAVGTDPNSATNTPTGAAATAGSIQSLTLGKVSIKLNFAKTNADAIGFAGTFAVPAGFKTAGAKVSFDIGGIAKSFVLDAKGGSKKNGDTFKLAVKSSKGNVAAQTSKFAMTAKGGSFAAALAGAGLVGTADVKGKPVTVVFTAIFNNTVLQKARTLTYTAKKGKTGSAK